MKMICDVPDEVIKSVRDGTWLGSSVLEKMIAYGTPLPKGHGRLIDENDFEKRIAILTHSMDLGYGEIMDVIDEIPTIIEADTESEEQE